MHDPKSTLRKGETGPLPEDAPTALAWLYRMFAAMKALFASADKLPELAEFLPEEGARPEAQPFVVVAWTSARAYHQAEVDALWPYREDPEVLQGIGVHLANLEDIQKAGKDSAMVLGDAQSRDPEEVDWLIADMATKHKGAALTLMGPGVCLRLNRKARRAALSRVKRALRREMRKDARERGARHS
jgi:hypothetical protein